MSKSSAPMPHPSAAIIVRISSLPSILSKRAFSTFRILPLSGRIAWNRRSRPCLADPPAESPSTMYSSLSAGSRSWQSASLPGSALLSSAPLRRTRSRALRAASRARAASTRLRDDALRDGRVLFEVRAQLLVDDGLDDALHLGVAELGLRLALELRARDLDADDAGQALADVVAADAFARVLRQLVLRRVEVDRPREGRAEARQVRAALVRVDVVRERVDRLRVAVVPLQRDLGDDAVLVAPHVDRLLVAPPPCSCSGASTNETMPPSYLKSWRFAVPLVLERDAQPGFRNASSRSRCASVSN